MACGATSSGHLRPDSRAASGWQLGPSRGTSSPGPSYGPVVVLGCGLLGRPLAGTGRIHRRSCRGCGFSVRSTPPSNPGRAVRARPRRSPATQRARPATGRRGQVVSVDRLVEDLWNGEAAAAGDRRAPGLRLAPAPSPGTRPGAAHPGDDPGQRTARIRDPGAAGCGRRLAVRIPGPAGRRTGSSIARPGPAGGGAGPLAGPGYAEFAAESWAADGGGPAGGLRIVARERWCEAVLRARRRRPRPCWPPRC